MYKNNLKLETIKYAKEKGFEPLLGTRALIADAQDIQQWLLEEKNILVLVDYIYECDDTPYCYKIYKLGENGKPERWPINGARYELDEHGNEVEIIETVGWSDFKKSYQDFHTYSEAIESGINEALEMIDKKQNEDVHGEGEK